MPLSPVNPESCFFLAMSPWEMLALVQIFATPVFIPVLCSMYNV